MPCNQSPKISVYSAAAVDGNALEYMHKIPESVLSQGASVIRSVHAFL